MHSVLAKTFGGLSASYYFRHFVFGLIFPVVTYFSIQGKPVHLPLLLTVAVNTLLYPYSRFVYEGVIDFIIGRNVFLVDGILLLASKVATMLFCWAAAILIAPVGLAYLYCYHSKAISRR